MRAVEPDVANIAGCTDELELDLRNSEPVAREAMVLHVVVRVPMQVPMGVTPCRRHEGMRLSLPGSHASDERSRTPPRLAARH